MPRSSGVYSLPSGKSPVGGTTASASDMNDILNDIASDLNTDRPVVAGGTGASTAADARTNLGLGNVDNTSDANKPVSSATQTALDLKANLASPALTGTPTAPTAAAGTNTTQIATMAALQTAASPSGMVGWFAMDSAPTGWLKADGSAVSRTTYAALFTAIGTTFGSGDGSTTFNLPDLRGEFVRGWDDSKGTDSGRVFGSSQAGQNAEHTHDLVIPGVGYANAVASGVNAVSGTDQSGSPTNVSGLVSSQGGAEARPRNIALLACIKA